MDELRPGLRETLKGQRGMLARVTRGGKLSVGDRDSRRTYRLILPHAKVFLDALTAWHEPMIRAVLFDLDGTLRFNYPAPLMRFFEFAREMGLSSCANGDGAAQRRALGAFLLVRQAQWRCSSLGRP